MKLGVISVGSMGWHHARVYGELPDVGLVGVFDMNKNRGKEIAKRYNCEFLEPRDLLKRVDAVSVAVPTPLHKKIGVECFKKGVSVPMEKLLYVSP